MNESSKNKTVRPSRHGTRDWLAPVDDRGVLTRAQVDQLLAQIMSMTHAGTVGVTLTHTKRVSTSFANNRILTSDDGNSLQLEITTAFGGRSGVTIETNQADATSLRAIVQQCEAVAHGMMGMAERFGDPVQYQDTYLPTQLWHDSTVRAMNSARGTVIPEIIGDVAGAGLMASGALGFIARAKAVLTKEGITAYAEETDAELTVTARSRDGKAVGWAGGAARDWTTVPYAAVTQRAIELSKMSVGARALEPGRRTAILSPTAFVQMARYFAPEFDAFDTDGGYTVFSKEGGRNRLHERVVDPRITMFSDPQDVLGGYPSFFFTGFANPRMTWVENGVLKNLAYNPAYAMERGKVYSEQPRSIHITGGETTVEEMIAQCEEGIYVNRLSNVELIDKHSGLMTGATHGGCFLIKHGKITMPVKNFQILMSPIFVLNNVIALGKPERAAFGYTPPGPWEWDWGWPRPPIIVPWMMVRDFNFSALVDAV